jgi:hypothetical protein
MELSSIDGAAAKWQRRSRSPCSHRGARLRLDLGVRPLPQRAPSPAHEAVFECWTTIAAISQRTSRVRLGQMVGCNSYRNPGVLAKITSPSTSSAVGASTGASAPAGTRTSTRATASSSRSRRTASACCNESVEIVRSMWTQPETNYDGEVLQALAGQLRPQAAAVAAPADLDRRRWRAAHAAGGGEVRRLLELRWQARRVGAQARDPEGALRGRRPRRGDHRQDLVARGVHPRDRGRTRGGRFAQPVGRAVRGMA